MEVLIQQIDPMGTGRVTFSMFRAGIETFLTSRESHTLPHTLHHGGLLFISLPSFHSLSLSSFSLCSHSLLPFSPLSLPLHLLSPSSLSSLPSLPLTHTTGSARSRSTSQGSSNIDLPSSPTEVCNKHNTSCISYSPTWW